MSAEADTLGTEWYRRLGDIPSISYTTPVGVDPPAAQASLLPTVHRFTGLDGKQVEMLEWAGPDGFTSASPAHERAFGDEARSMETSELLRYLYESLELPGEPSDYHFAIQGTVEELWRRRRSEPNVMVDIERLSWLDIALIEARPAAVWFDSPEGGRFARVLAFGWLSSLYEREGAWRDSLAVVQRGAQLGQGDPSEALLLHIAALDAEDTDD